MVTRISILFLFSLVLIGCGPDRASDLQQMMVKGEVAEITENQKLVFENASEGMQDALSTETHKFNKNGDVVSFKSINHRAQRNTMIDYSYDPEGRKASAVMKHTNPQIIFNKKFEYPEDINGYVIRNFGEDNKATGIQEFHLDENGFPQTEYNKDPDGEVRHQVSHEWVDGKFLSKKIFDADSNLIESTTYEFDGDYPKSKTTKDHRRDRQHTETFTYEFDNQGNWTKKTVLVDGRPTVTVTRVIVYR